MKYQDIAALAAVIEHGSFERAADQLAITQSAVSQRIRKLESTLGQTLLVRSTPPALTDCGERVMRHHQQVAQLRQDLLEQLQGPDRDWQRVAIGSNADSLATWLPGALQRLRQRQPRLLLDVQTADQDQTHALLRRGAVIGCISSSADAISGCNCFPLGVMTYRALASPAYLDRHCADGVHREALAQAPCLEFSADDELQRRFLREVFDMDYRAPRHRVPSTESFRAFVERGWGWGMVPDLQSEDSRRDGRLLELSPDRPLEVPLYWHIWNLQTRLYRDLTDCLRGEAARVLAPLG
jgi:LysR family transcriptional regulator (chromosome initiation inhibitor)